jgi:Colicin E5 ribonuclease domain
MKGPVMTHRAVSTLGGSLVILVATPSPAYADNCSSFKDCYGVLQSATTAAAGLAILIGLAVLVAPGLLGHGLEPTPAPDPASDETSGVEPPGVAERPVVYDEKALANMASRGWSRSTVEETARSYRFLRAAGDTRFNVDGTRDDEPATVFIRADGWYIVLNDRSHDVVQVSAGPLDGWRPARPQGWTKSLPGRIAEEARAPVVFAGSEACYLMSGMDRVIDVCEEHRVRLIGLEGFTGGPDGLMPRLDMILDCSAERNSDGRPSTPGECARSARQLLYIWRQEQPGSFINITVA